MNEGQKLRTAIVFFFFIFLYSVLLINLALTQLYQGCFFSSLGRRQYTMKVTLPAQRAEIIDRNGHKLAHNMESISAFILPKKLEDPEKLLSFLEQNFQDAYQRYTYQGLKNHSDSNFFYIKRKLSKDELELIDKSAIDDIKLLREPSRYYPASAAGPVVGITDIDNKGILGIEKVFEKNLSGLSSTVMLEREARSGLFHFSKELTESGRDASPIQLTLDADLQFLISEELKDIVDQFQAESGAVLVMDPVTGDVLTMVHYPDFDSNNVRGVSYDRMRNKIVTDVHELGSVMKAFVALAAFEEGVVEPDEIIDCENTKSTLINGMRVNTVVADGEIPFSQVMSGSNNIGMAKVALRLGPKLYDHYVKLGFGALSGLGFPGEQKGTITHPSRWSKKSLFSLSYGYEISANLMQLGRAFSVIATDGLSVTPRLVMNSKEESDKSSIRLYSKQAIAKLKNILLSTVEQGTARRARIEGYQLMGKTGSADLLVGQKYDKDRSIFTFAGIVKKNDYQRVIITFVKNVTRKRLYASSVTVPLFRNVVEKMLIHDKQI